MAFLFLFRGSGFLLAALRGLVQRILDEHETTDHEAKLVVLVEDGESGLATRAV
jgi:hypothetical protein